MNMNKKHSHIVISFLIIVSFAAFGRIMGNHFINLDDPGYITKNYIVQNGLSLENIRWAFTTTYLAFWHPLTWLSHMLDWSIFGAYAGGHHLTSLLLHIGSVLFLFLFLNKTTKNIWAAAFAAAFFAIHPLRVESVAWASERKDVLSMFFGMAGIYAYAFYAGTLKRSQYFLCLMLFVLSLMAKPMTVTLPFVLLLLDYWPLQRFKKVPFYKEAGRLAWEKFPFFLMSIVSSAIVFWAEKKAGAVSSAAALPLSTRMANAIFSYGAYLEKTFWPDNLIVFYPYNFFLPAWKIILSGTVLTLMTLAVIVYIKKHPCLFVGWFWYLGTLIPMIGLVQIGKHAMADRYTYLPSVGISIMLAWSLPLLFKNRKFRKRILLPAAIILLVFLSMLTWKQCGYWKSSMSLFNHAKRVMGPDVQAREHMGADFTQLGQYQQQNQILDCDKAIRLSPNDAEAFFNRGMAYSKIGQYENAIKDYTEAIRLNPDYAEAYNNRGTIYGQHGAFRLAVEDFNKVIAINPRHAKAFNNRGLAYSELEQQQAAIQDFNKAIHLKPDYAAAYTNRANAYLKSGNQSEACQDAKKACERGNCSFIRSLQNKKMCH